MRHPSIAGSKIAADLNTPQVVVLACDNMTAGKGVYDLDGPAVTLHERFLWRLFGGDSALYDRYKDHYADKSKIVDALKAVNRPVLILVDEIMDYIRQLSDSALHDLAVKDMAFLRALLDSVNDVAQRRHGRRDDRVREGQHGPRRRGPVAPRRTRPVAGPQRQARDDQRQHGLRRDPAPSSVRSDPPERGRRARQRRPSPTR